MFLAVWWGLLVLLWACAGRLSCKSSTQPTFFVGILKIHGYVTNVMKFMRSFSNRWDQFGMEGLA